MKESEMYELSSMETQSVCGAGLLNTIKTVWHDVVQWANTKTNEVNGDIGDLITQGQPGSNPACNALGNSLGLVGQVAGTANGGTSMGNAGDICNNAANSVQHNLAQQPASGMSAQ
jgi:hypothetical protein